MKTRKSLIFFLSLLTLVFISFVINGVNGQDVNKQGVVNSEFNGIWVGVIASYPAGINKNNINLETCVKCDREPQCANNQILIQRTCTKCAYCVDRTSPDVLNFITNTINDVLTKFGNILSTVSINLINPLATPSSSGSHTSTSSSSGTVSSSSGLLLPDSSFSNAGGIPKGTKQSNAPAGIISLDLFVQEGKLKGSIQIENIISDGYVVSQNVTSQDEIEINVKDKAGKVVLLKLKLFGKPLFKGIFVDGISIEQKKLTSFYSYLVPSTGFVNRQITPPAKTKPQPKIDKTPVVPPKSTSGQVGRPGRETGGRSGGEESGRAGGGEAGGDEGGRAGGETGGRSGGETGGRAGGETTGRAGGDKSNRVDGEEGGRPGGDN